MLHLKVQTDSATFYKYWTEHWQSLVESSECLELFMVMVSQMARAFGIAIEAKALAKNLMNKNSGYVTQVKEAKEATKKSKLKVEALKKSQAEESTKHASALEEIENLKRRSTYPRTR